MLIIGVDAMVSLQIITDPAISFVGTFLMDLFNLFCNSEIVLFCFWKFAVQPFIVGSPGYFSNPAEFCDWIVVFFIFLSDCLINVLLFQPAQPRLLSISSSFFKKDASISARCLRAFSSFNSARSFSTSERESSGFLFPLRSCNASRPPASYFTV